MKTSRKSALANEEHVRLFSFIEENQADKPGIIILVNNNGIRCKLQASLENEEGPIFLQNEMPELLWGYVREQNTIINIHVYEGIKHSESETLKKLNWGLTLRGCKIISLSYKLVRGEVGRLFREIEQDVLKKISEIRLKSN